MVTQIERGPLLYISQPELKLPRVKMQETFSLRKAKEVRENLQKMKLENPFTEGLPHDKHHLTEEEKKGGILTTGDVTTNQQEDSTETIEAPMDSYFKRVKPFKEMDLLEKLEYLLDFPKQLPPVPCLFESNQQVIRGILIGKNNEHIQLQLPDKSEISIPIDSLKDIRMMGFH